jgi:calcium-dependent protein kinase
VHRDLKPENILLDESVTTHGRSQLTIKLIDFGTSKLFGSNEVMRKRIGTPYYIAPEVLNQKYDQRCDIWSIGVILYVLFCGYPPFNGPDDSKIYKSILKDKLSFDGPAWANISSDAIDLVTQLLQKDPNERISI